jgi:hypothetical protein
MSDPFPGHAEEAAKGTSPRILLFSALLLAAALIAFFLWYGSGRKETPGATAHLPFGTAEQAYASAIRVEGITLDRTENYLHQEVTTIRGSLVNSGDRAVRGVELSVEFQDDLDQVVLRHPFLSVAAEPLAPRSARDLEISLEHIPGSWNRREPVFRVAGLEFHAKR